MQKYLVLVFLATVAQASKMFYGSCPKFPASVAPERYNSTKAAGLWYEYMYDLDFREDGTYECSSWNLLTIGDGNYQLLRHSLNMSKPSYASSEYGR